MGTMRVYNFYRHENNTIILPTETIFTNGYTVVSEHEGPYYLMPVSIDLVQPVLEKFCKEKDLLLTLNHNHSILDDLNMVDCFSVYSSYSDSPLQSIDELNHLLEGWFDVKPAEMLKLTGDRVRINFFTKVSQLEEESRRRYRAQEALKEKVNVS